MTEFTKPNIITPEEFARCMKEIEEKYYWDEEMCHIKMDGLLMETLESLGYGEGVEIFNNATKWYV